MNVSSGRVTSDILPSDERNNPQVAEDDDESIPDLECVHGRVGHGHFGPDPISKILLQVRHGVRLGLMAIAAGGGTLRRGGG